MFGVHPLFRADLNLINLLESTIESRVNIKMIQDSEIYGSDKNVERPMLEIIRGRITSNISGFL